MVDLNIECHSLNSVEIQKIKTGLGQEWVDELEKKAEVAEKIYLMTVFKDLLLPFCENFLDKIELMPYINCSAFHPDRIGFKTKDGNYIVTLMKNGNSAIALYGFQNGLSVDETILLFCEDVFEYLGYFDVWKKSLSWAQSEERMTGWPVIQWYQKWRTEGVFVHTPNHPILRVHAEISRYLLDRHSIELEVSEPENVIIDCGLRQTVWPVYPEIAEQLGVEGSYKFKMAETIQKEFEYETDSISLREYVEDCFNRYTIIGKDNFSNSILDKEPFASLKESWSFKAAMNRGKNESTNPYSNLADHRFWRRSVSKLRMTEIDPVVKADFAILKTDKVSTAGSCFAQQLARTLKQYDFNYFTTEFAPEGTSEEEVKRRNFNVYSARYGNIYTTRHLVQMVDRITGAFTPIDNAWLREDGKYVDPFRPLVEPDGFDTIEDLENSREKNFASIIEMFENLDIFIFTLGLTEAWRSKVDGAVFTLAPGVAGGVMDHEKYEFVNFTIEMVVKDLERFVEYLFKVNPTAKIIFTVSPVPMIATYENRHVISSTTYSKSVLRVAAEEISRYNPNIAYFPSYEIVTSNFSRGKYYSDDLRSVTEDGIKHIMRLFIQHYMVEDSEFVSVNLEDIICDEEMITD